MLHASLLVIGDEILTGFVQDTNSGWVARRLHHHGVPLSRIHTVPDDLEAIAEALAAELARARPRVVLTSGGLGSTPDDLTFEAVAHGLDRPLVAHPELTERIDGALDWTREQGVEVSDELAWHMLRMARIPEGGTLLPGGSGFMPGVRVDVDGGIDDDGRGATVVILPGVPGQLRAIVEHGVEPILLAGRNEPPVVLELTHSFPESVLNPAFAEVMEEYPRVRLGSYPGVPMRVRLSGPPEATQAAAAVIRDRIRRLEDDPAGERLAAAWTSRWEQEPAS